VHLGSAEGREAACACKRIQLKDREQSSGAYQSEIVIGGGGKSLIGIEIKSKEKNYALQGSGSVRKRRREKKPARIEGKQVPVESSRSDEGTPSRRKEGEKLE